MHHVTLRAFSLFAGLAWIGCGSSETDFTRPDRGGTGGGAGSAGAQQSGSGGSQAGGSQGGAGGAQQGGAAGSQQGGGTAGGGAGNGGSSPQGGAAGTASGGANGSGGTTSSSFSCGTLMCFSGQQLCRTTLPAVPGGSTQYMCQPFPDNCIARDCSCFCNPPQQSPCGPASACMCRDDEGHVQITCAGA